MTAGSTGKLLVIGTPIGNLSDLSSRVAESFRSCTLLLCEDTRHSATLLRHLGIEVRTESFHDHNEDAKLSRIIDRLKAGETIGLISDAGMPVLSDPGFALVRAAHEAAISVIPIPGPFAGALALAASGIPPLPFTFYGFTPHRKEARRIFYRDVAAHDTTAVVYESPERLVASLEDALEILGDVTVAVAREMTKMHEEIARGAISDVIERFGQRVSIRGEITIVFARPQKVTAAPSPDEIAREMQRLRDEGMKRSDAARLLAERYGLRRSDVYNGRVKGEG